MKKIWKLIMTLLGVLAIVIIAISMKKSKENVNANATKSDESYSYNDLYKSIKQVDNLPEDAVFETDKKMVKLSDGKFSCYYKALTTSQKSLYDQLDAGITTYSTNAVKISGINLYQMGKDEFFDAIWSWFYSNPDIYWITSECSYTYKSTGDITAIYFTSYECNVELFNNRVQSIVSEVSKCDSDYEALHTIQQLVCENVEYDYDFNNILMNQTTYSAIAGRSVCAGYGRAMNYIANLCGIEGVESVVTQEHLFNYYLENGKAYLMDLTWDDGDPVRYDYFLIGSESLARIDSSIHHTAIVYDVFPALSKEDYIVSAEPEETTPYVEPTTSYVEPTTSYVEPTTPYVEPTTPYVEPTTPYVESTTPYVEPTTSYEEPTTSYEEPTTPYEEPTEAPSKPNEWLFTINRSDEECKKLLDNNQIVLSIDENEGDRWLVFGLSYSYINKIEQDEIEWFSYDESIASWDKELGFFLEAIGDGTTIVGVRVYIDGKIRTDHILVTVKDGKFVNALYEKH